MKKRFTFLIAALMLLVFMMPTMAGWGQTRAEGDELAVCQGTGSGYGTRRTLTDSHNVGWVLASGQSGYLGAHNATSHNNVKPTAADLPVVKAVKSDATTSTKGYYFYYTTTAVANVGSLEFSYTGNSGNTSATAYVVVGDALSASGGDAYEIITLASNSSTAQGASLGSSGTFTYTFSETQISSRFYGFIIVTSSYKRLTAGTIKLKEGAIATVSYTVTLGDDNTTLTEANPGAGVTLPSRDDIGDYKFAGWNTTNITEETTTAPGIIPAGLYHPTADITLYPVYSRSESGATTFTKVVSSSIAGHPSGITEGVYALLTGSDKAFNGSISSGHGQSTTDAFVFTDNVATSAPSGTCEITMVPVMSGETILGYKMYNANYGYLYASAASSGKLAWQATESNYWSYSNYDWCYNANNAHLRVYNDSFRTYGGTNYSQIKVARKGIGSTTYYISVVSITYTVTYDGNGNTSGSVPTDATAYSAGATVTVLGNTGNLAKTGYTFGGWNTRADGDGTNYSAESTFTISENTTLYAKWNAKTITGLSYLGTPTQTTYSAGESFDPTGLTVTATYNDASQEDVTSLVTWTPDPLTQGTTSVTGTYMEQTVNVSGLTVNAVPGTADNPYTVAQALAASASTGVYVRGIVSSVYSTSLTNNGQIRYYISDDGTTSSQMNVYNGLGINGAAFTSINDVQVGDEVVVTGDISVFSNANQLNANNQLVSLKLVKPTFSPAAGAVTSGTTVEISDLHTTSTTIYYTTDGSTPTTSSTVFSAPITITAATTIKAIAVKEGYTTSDVAEAAYTLNTTPAISVNPTSLTGFTYVVDNGPSTTKTVSVSGANLTADITLSLGNNSDFEMSTTEGSGYTNSLTLTQSEGSVSATKIYVRLKADLEANNNYSGTITLTSTDATNATVGLSGSVTQPSQTWDLSTNSYSESTEDLVTWLSDYVTMTNAKHNSSTSANNYLGGNSYDHTRFYKDQKLTITPVPGYAITSVEITAVSNYVNGFTQNTWTNATASADGTTITVTPATGTQAISVVIYAACRATEVIVYYTEQNSAPVWETLPAPTIAINEEYEITLTDYVTASPAPTITLSSTSADNELYDYENGYLFFQPTTAGTYAFTFTATNSVGSANVTLTITVAYTIEFKINGVKDNVLTMLVNDGDELGELPVPTTIPNGFAFVGWMESTETPYYNATTQPTMVSSSSEPSGNMTLEAVFCASQWLLTNVAPVDGDKVILAAFDNGTYYAMAGASRLQLAVENDIITTTNLTTPNPIFTVNVSEDNLYLKQGDNYLHVNNSALNVTTNTTNGSVVFNSQDDGSFIVARKNNDRWIRYTGSGFTSASSLENASKLFLFKYISSSSEYTTEVTESIAAGTVSGYNHIFGEVSPTGNITISGNIVIHKGGVLNMGSYSLTNGTAANLIIKDGGQLKVYATDTKDGEVQATVEKNITHYTVIQNHDEYLTDGWYFIASPINSNALAPTDVTNMLSNAYDLYQLNNTKWENYENQDHTEGFTIDNGRGYLYANSADVTLSFAGAIKPFNKETPTANQVAVKTGWNLIGNPFTFNVYADVPYYAMNAEGTGITANTVATSTAIAPCTSIVIKAENASTVNFSETSPVLSTGDHGNLQMLLAHKVATRDGASVNKNIDNAIVSFNEGSQLEKFYFGNPSASIFIPQNGEDYAIAFSDRQGDVPLYFKANETGTYTISFAGDEMSLNGIYLIDILAEEEIDLSVEPSYTFIGSPADRMARFKIVFRNANGDGTSDIFAYQNGNDIIVSGEGELQIFDVMGRMVSRQCVNGVETVNVKSQGVYIFRLNDKTQKIVVR